MRADVVQFVPRGQGSPFKELIDPMELAELDIEAACFEMCQIVHRTGDLNRVLALRRRIDQLVVKVTDVVELAQAKANRLTCR